jgi:hypothetical protein
VSINLDTGDAEASAAALRAKLRELTTGAPADVAGEFDERSDKPILRISRHHGNVKSSVLTQDFVIGADYATPGRSGFCVPWPDRCQSHARRRRPAQRKKRSLTSPAMRWLIGQAENGSSRQRYKGLGTCPRFGKPRLTRKVRRCSRCRSTTPSKPTAVHHADMTRSSRAASSSNKPLRAGISIFDVFQV